MKMGKLLAVSLLLGVALPLAAADILIKDPGYHLFFTLKADRSLVDSAGKTVAHLPQGGAILDAARHTVGSVQSDGLVRNAAGKIIGRVREDGEVLDAGSHIVGSIASSGLILSGDYTTLAHVEGEGWDPAQVAAFWFFFKEVVAPDSVPAQEPVKKEPGERSPKGAEKTPAAKPAK